MDDSHELTLFDLLLSSANYLPLRLWMRTVAQCILGFLGTCFA